MRQHIQQEVKVNKLNLKQVFWVCQDKFVFDLTLSPFYCSFVLSLSAIVIFINLSAV